MLKYLKVFIFILVANVAFATGSILEGKVTDKGTGEGLAGAKITVVETGAVVYSDFDGNFTIKGLKEGVNYTFEISSLGYEDTTGKTFKSKEAKCYNGVTFALTEK